MIITIKGEGAEDFAEALAYHFNVVQVPVKEIIVGGEAFEFSVEPGASQPMCKSKGPVTIEVLT